MGGIGLGLVRMVRPWNEWLIVWGYDINQPPPEVDDEMATRIVHELVGDDTVPVTIRSTSLWGNNKMYATRYDAGRVFCAGDAVHRHPPSNGLGSNTSIQDSYNLAWKLAFVLRGVAGPGLLASYDAERAPVGRQIVLRANRSIEEFGPIFAALGLTDTADPELMRARIAARADATPEAAQQREALRKALEGKDYEFNAHGVELGQRYASGAVVADGTQEPRPTAATRSCTTTPPPGPAPGCPTCGWDAAPSGSPPSTWPGTVASACSPASVGRRGWTRPSRSPPSWVWSCPPTSSAPAASTSTSTTTGPACGRVGEAGCVLVRPDAHVAWRSHDLPDDPTTALRDVLRAVLALPR